MWSAWQETMNVTVIAFVVMAFVACSFAFATMAHEFNLRLFAPTQTGDSSLSPSSVNWLGATALAGALFICFVLY